MRSFLVALAAILVAPLAAVAEGPGETVIREEDKVVYEKETKLEFDDGVVDGDLLAPDGDVVRTNRRAEFQSMIQKRRDFFEEIEKSVDE